MNTRNLMIGEVFRTATIIKYLVVLLLTLALPGCAAPPAVQPTPLPTSTPSPAPGTPPGGATSVSTALPDTMDCLLVSTQSTPGSTEPSIFPPPGPDDHTLGPADAQVTFLEYTDYQAPASAALDGVLDKLARKYPKTVRRVFRLFPLPNNDKSSLAAALAEAAARQDKFWEMSQLLTDRQSEWVNLDKAAFQDWANQRALEIGLDAALLKKDLASQAVQTLVSGAQHFGLASSIPTMPFLLVNGRIYQGPRDLRSLENLTNLLHMEPLQFTDCPAFIIDPQKSYIAELTTSKGVITIQLFPKEAPLAVNNFVFLARKGWYNGVTFHRVIKGQLAQSGDPSGTGFGSPGYAFRDEISNLVFNRPGVLAMANAGPDSNGSQFFITLAPLPALNGSNTIFGQVIKGLEILPLLTERDPSQPVALPDGDPILKIDIREQ